MGDAVQNQGLTSAQKIVIDSVDALIANITSLLPDAAAVINGGNTNNNLLNEFLSNIVFKFDC